jgi:phenylalanyl-tRNA synthetase beta chain
MKVLYSWLNDFVNLDISVNELADKLTMAGMEVTDLKKIGDDWLLEIEVTPNRPDCLSVLGIARECGLVLGKRIKPPKIPFIPRTSATYIRENEFEVIIKNPDACPRYIARILMDVEIRPSPEFIQARLEKIGLRPINNIVDITNYILFELGQPMHAFDYDKLDGKRIIVRFAEENEKIVTLDGQERQLTPQDLVIADISRPVALAGIMGGENTEVTEDTRNVLLESAYFDPITIRRTSQRLGLSTESSYRFERGVDFINVEQASLYAVEMIRKYASKNKRTLVHIDKCLDVIKKHIPASNKVILKFSDVNKFLGVMPSAFWIRKTIQALGCEIFGLSKEGLKIQSPSFRQDLKQPIDYIEEIARLYGYDKIPENQLPEIDVSQESALEEFGEREFENRLRDISQKLGLKEVISYALLSEQEVEKFQFKNVLPLNNPLSKTHAILRPSIIPSLLKVAQYNFNHFVNDIAIFELGKIYGLNDKPWERKVLGILLSGKAYNDYFGVSIEYNFYHLKGIFEKIMNYFGIEEYQISEFKTPLFSKNACLEIKKQSETIAIMGMASSSVKEYYDLKKDVLVMEIYIDIVKKFKSRELRFKPLPQFPFILRDISILLPRDFEVGKVIERIRNMSDLIAEVVVIDFYTGAQISRDKKSITLRIKFQSQDRTLKDEEIDPIILKIKDNLAQNLPVEFR